MNLKQLFDGNDETVQVMMQTGRDLEITGMSADSRAVRPGYLFAALPGTRADGRTFIDAAIAKGAVAVLAPLDTKIARPIALITDANPRRRFARMAARFFDRQPDTIAAVTGTNGKTSVAIFARQLWAALGRPAASLGTIGLQTPSRVVAGNLTTPDPVALHRDLADLADEGVTHLALEASSHGLDQYRLDGVRIGIAAFTNLSRDHLDYHGDMAAYLASKSRLFAAVMDEQGTAVLNADVPEFAPLAAICRDRGIRVLDYGERAAYLRMDEVTPTPDGLRFRLAVAGAARDVALPLAGRFQAWNAVAAAGIVIASGEDPDKVCAALGALSGVPGRMETVARRRNGAAVIVDYAHTPDALETALRALRPHTAGRLAVVFGCGGDRDTGKRPQMGAIAAERADQVYVTDDNPRSESPDAIRADVMTACPEAQNIGDRREAIERAVEDLAIGDLLLIAGKGHEQGQTVGDRVLPFDDAVVAREAVNRMEKGKRS